MSAKQGAEIIVEKIFKDHDDLVSPEKQALPRLYLELLENKEKVIPEVRQVEYEEPVETRDEIELIATPEERSRSPPILIKESIIQDSSPSVREPVLQESVLHLLEPSPFRVVEQHVVKPVSPPPLPPKLADIIPEYRKESFPRLLEENREQPPPQKTPIDSKTLEKKQRLLLKLDILKKSSKSTKIPNFSLTSDYSEMKTTYKTLVKRVHIDNKVVWMRNILVGACGVVELGLGDMGLGLDMEGFTEFQMTSMSKYDKLLVKIGEKSYKPKTVSTWPVEAQLLFLVFVQTILFIGAKFLKEKTGANILGFFQTMTGNKKTDNLSLPK
jgi:hypothetical protein